MLVESIWLRYHLIMPADRLYRVIERLGYLLRTDIHRDRDGHGALQPAQRAALEYLARCNRLSNTPAAVTEFLQLTKGTVSQTLGVLARRGLVEKRRDGTDRRVVRLALTPAGRRVVAVRGRIWRRACEALDAKQIARAGALLEDVVRGAQRASATRSFGGCHDCRMLGRERGGRYRCGLVDEPLSVAETRKICRQHAPLNRKSRPNRG
jgi:DNA-binding MarR family transcriptional regulator